VRVCSGQDVASATGGQAIRRFACVLASGAVAVVAASACVMADESVRAPIALSFTAPRGVLDKAKQLELRVLEGEVTCEPSTGIVTLPGGEAGAREVVKSNLGQDGCPQNVKFCGNVTIPKSADSRIFEAKARDGANLLALGCATATIDQDVVPLAIEMLRFLPPAVCGDGTVQPTEQCEPGGTVLCDDTCQSKELLLSVGSIDNATSTGKSGDKTNPFFLWPQATGDAGRFLAFFSDLAVPAAGGTSDVGLRIMGEDLAPLTTPAPLASSIFLPNGGAFPPAATPLQQSLPQATALAGKYYVVFQDDADGTLDVHLRVLNNQFDAEGGTTPLTVNGTTTGEPGLQTAPAIAASSDRLFVAWEDQTGGTIVGRTLNGALTLGSQNQLSTGNGNVRPRVAATSNKGFVAVWKSETGIKLRAVDTNGTPSGGEQAVSEGGAGADGGQVASLPDGRFAVVWSKGGDVFFQRYDERGLPIAGDQVEPLNDLVKDGDQTQPTIATTPAGGGSYVVAWHDAGTGHIRARFLGGRAGFLLNNVNGDTTEFQASRIDGHERAAPTIAVGGSGPFVAIGWEDRSAQTPGIVARRFPLPRE
jgi:hypothetical protein